MARRSRAPIPLAFALGVALDAILTVPSWVPMSVSTTVALAVLADGLFVRPPQRPVRPRGSDRDWILTL